jgi:hypothetical protein
MRESDGAPAEINEPRSLSEFTDDYVPPPGGGFVRDFSNCAGVPVSRRDQFEREVDTALTWWHLDIAHHSNEGHPHRILHKMLKHAEALNDQLGAIVANLESFPQSHLLLNVGFRLLHAPTHEAFKGLKFDKEGEEYNVHDIHAITSALVDVITQALQGRTQSAGMLPGIDGYPGLYMFVYRLELAAQRAGGAFSAHKKNGCKGTLLDGLNKMREWWLAVEKGWSTFSKCLPPKGGHPVATYERILTRARQDLARAKDQH